jgi:hypothetical protein
MSEDLAAFVAARLDELAEADWHVLDCSGMPHEDGHCCEVGRWLARDVEAKRAILRRCAAHMNEPDQWPNGLVSPRAVLARQALVALADIWNDHPDYRAEWKP